MTADKTIAIAYDIARNACPEEFPLFEKNWRIYLTKTVADMNPVLGHCAALINDALESMDSKSGSRSKLTVAKRMINGCSRENFQGVFLDSDGHSCICDGFRAVRLTDSFASLPTVPAWQELPRVFAEPETYTRPLTLPTVTEIKKHVAQQKAAEGKNCRPAWDFGEDLPLVSAEYLIDMLSIMPGCTAYIAARNAERSPIYFRAENGDGVLLPVRKNR